MSGERREAAKEKKTTLEAGDDALARLAERFDATEVYYGLTNVGQGWRASLTWSKQFSGASADEAAQNAIAAYEAALREGRGQDAAFCTHGLPPETGGRQAEHFFGAGLCGPPLGPQPLQDGGERDDREWTLRWDHRQLKHYIDGPSDGRQMEGLVVVPKSSRAAEQEAERLREAVKRLIAVTELPGTRSELSVHTERAKSFARAALSPPPDEGER
jgi:hypothetical protein